VTVSPSTSVKVPMRPPLEMTAAGAMRASRISSEEVREAVSWDTVEVLFIQRAELWWCRSDGEESAACEEETGNTPLVVRLAYARKLRRATGGLVAGLPGAIAVHLVD